MEKINLFCFPFAGGSKYSYRGYAKAAPASLRVIPVELPGRGARFRDPLLTDMDRIVDDVFDQVKNELNEPYAMYGHSMGTVVGYLLTRRILGAALPPPLQLFLSGRGGPSLTDRGPVLHALPRTPFVEKIRELGGCPEEVLRDAELMHFYEPILRADFRALETYAYAETGPFDVPIAVMIGEDENVTLDEAGAWGAETTQPLLVRSFPGNHFFIFDHEAAIMDTVAGQLQARVREVTADAVLC